MNNDFMIQGTCLTVLLPAELDHAAADYIRHETDRIIGRCCVRSIRFDFQNTIFMDSSGVGMLMGRYKALGMQRGCVQVINTTEHIRKILHISGLFKIINLKEQQLMQKGGSK